MRDLLLQVSRGRVGGRGTFVYLLLGLMLGNTHTHIHPPFYRWGH